VISKRIAYNILSFMLVFAIAIALYICIPHKPILHETKQVTDSTQGIQNNETTQAKQKKINPNTATFEELCSIGFSKKQAYNCLNYIKAGNTFTTVEDLKKLYTLTPEDFKKLSLHLYIPQTKKNNREHKEFTEQFEKKSKNIYTVSLNTCDSAELTKIPGIGGFRAKKIIEYRLKLGGFYSINQLRSIYSFDSLVIEKITPYISIDTSHIQKIQINKANFKEMQAHPYISYNQAKHIMEYRKIVGRIESIEELQKNNILKPEEFEILKYYIKTF